ncbi:MAG: hypothetical protein F6K41_39520 [Symploca sp. SIO3E6]|nr:hypothetical protein [Caldora sp. SIO3E6]
MRECEDEGDKGDKGDKEDKEEPVSIPNNKKQTTNNNSQFSILNSKSVTSQTSRG